MLSKIYSIFNYYSGFSPETTNSSQDSPPDATGQESLFPDVIDIDPNPETESSGLSEPPPAIELSIPLYLDEGRLHELGLKSWLPFLRKTSNDSGNSTPASPVPESEGIPPEIIAGDPKPTITHFVATIPRTSLGTYDGLPACLILFKFDFGSLSRAGKIKQAVIKVGFTDESTTSPRMASDYNPEVMRSAPIHVMGKKQPKSGGAPRRQRNISAVANASFDATVSVPGAPAGANVGLRIGGSYDGRRGKPQSSTCRAEVFSDINPTNFVTWDFRENGYTEHGIAEICNAAVVVRYVEGRRFGMHLKVMATVRSFMGVISAVEVLGKTDPNDPVIFDPARMRSGGRRFGALQIGSRSVDVPRNDTWQVEGSDFDLERFSYVRFSKEGTKGNKGIGGGGA